MSFFPLADTDWHAPPFDTFFRNFPDEVKAKIRRQQRTEEDAAVASGAYHEARQNKRRQIDDLRAAITMAERDKKGSPQDWTKEAQFRIDEMKINLSDLLAELRPEPSKLPVVKPDKMLQRAREYQQSVTPTVEEYLRKLNASTTRFAYVPATIPNKWNAERVGNEIDELLKGRISLVLMPLKAADSIAAAHAAVDALAARGAPGFTDCIRHGGAPEWPGEVFYTSDLGRSIATEYGIAFFAWMNPQPLKDRVAEEITKRVGDNGIGAADRKRKLADIDEKWLELQRVQEAIFDRDEADGKAVQRKVLHPLAMFCVERTEDAPANVVEYSDAAGEATIGMSFDALNDQRMIPKNMRKATEG